MARAAVLWHLNTFEPLRKSLRHVFLKEAGRADAAVITLHRNRPPAQVRQHQRRNHLVVRRQLAFRNSLTRKQDFVRMRDHLGSTTASRRGWRSLPCVVHSMNPTWTVIFGCTQCARSRGKPLATVNGGFGISSLSSCSRRSNSSFVSNPVPIFPAKTKSSFL